MKGYRIGAIVQARTSSTRLPGKILKDLPEKSGISVLEQVIRRLKKSGKLDVIIIATTVKKGDDRVVGIAKKTGVKYYRGSEKDVLSRYYLAAKENGLDVVVRITSDCPCIDPRVVDKAIATHFARKADYTSNTLVRSYPRGLDVEIFNFNVLEIACKKAKKSLDREHITPYIYGNPEIFKCVNFKMPQKTSAADIRITLDTEEDYALLCVIFDRLYRNDKFFGAKKIIDLFKKNPWLRLINKKVIQKKI